MAKNEMAASESQGSIEVVFVRDSFDYECGSSDPKFKRGTVVKLPEPSALRWIRRGAARRKSEVENVEAIRSSEAVVGIAPDSPVGTWPAQVKNIALSRGFSEDKAERAARVAHDAIADGSRNPDIIVGKAIAVIAGDGGGDNSK